MNIINNISASTQVHPTEIQQTFKTEMGDIHLTVIAGRFIDAKTLYTISRIGIETAMDDAGVGVEEGQSLP